MQSKANRSTGAATIQDVAKAAGVSTATVSRALSDPSKVTPATLERVNDAVKATRYVVNQAARNLRQRRSNSICVVAPDLSNSFFSAIISGIEQIATKAGFGVFVVETGMTGGGSFGPTNMIESARVDGLLVFDGQVNEQTLMNMQRQDRAVPTVLVLEWGSDTTIPSVTVDNIGGSKLAVDHLASLGHRRIGHVPGPPSHILTTLRTQGYQAALAANTLSVEPDLMFQGGFSLESGKQAAKQWLAMENRPTALYCASDLQAFGLISHLLSCGVNVPEEVSVVGFDDMEFSGYIYPPLTTIAQPRFEIGRRAAQLLLQQIHGEPYTNQSSICLDVSLVVRQSTATPPHPSNKQ